MPRPLVLGNGSLLLDLDERGAIRDLFYPQVGRFNHLSGHKIRMGIWTPSAFSWTDDPGWRRQQGYSPRTLVAESHLVSSTLGVSLDITEAVSPSLPIFVRRIRVSPTDPSPRELRIFFTHDLRLAETDIGDTAFYNPFLDAVIHYKGPHWLLFGGQSHLGGIYEYATGIKAFGGMEGTWRDAEDGHLSMNSIAQGSVDSSFSLKIDPRPGGADEAYYWIVAGDSLDGVSDVFHQMVGSTPAGIMAETTRFWPGWLGEQDAERRSVLGDAIANQVERSLLIMRTHCDREGAVVAATDSDIMATNRATYCYVWPRDGAFVSGVFDRLGHREVAREFFEFCLRITNREHPMFFQKYGPDGSLGASWHPWIVDGHAEVPVQQDETALVLLSVARHLKNTVADDPDLTRFIEGLLAPIADHLADCRDPVTGFPAPSWDLWEERRGIHAFTVAAIIAGLREAGGLSHPRASRWIEAADELSAALQGRMYDETRGVFFRRIVPVRGGFEPDPVIDSSVLAVGLLGAIPSDDPMVATSADAVETALTVHSSVGGIARYSGDYYFRASDAYPGNPWFICTLWLAQTRILLAGARDELEVARRWLEWAVQWSEPTGVMAEQLHPETGAPLSVSPLTWSHAEFVKTALDYAEAVPPLRSGGEGARG